MIWLKVVLVKDTAVIAMCNLRALPVYPVFYNRNGLNGLIDRALDDFMSIQNGGVDALMFSNDFSLPYLTKVIPETTAAMARIFGQLMT
ncbi:BtpA/SgcQ family protein, partial [Salmonella enterica subsp. enterica serovar Kentucky]|uniref:BtpA/SgcQ family protein n=1 Tax=Salmonella enterica TaxID=28901 RepID=UPI003F4B6806